MEEVDKAEGFRVLYSGRAVPQDAHRCRTPIMGARGTVIECKVCGKMHRCTERHHLWREFVLPEGDGPFAHMARSDNNDGIAIHAMWQEVGWIMTRIYRSRGV